MRTILRACLVGVVLAGCLAACGDDQGKAAKPVEGSNTQAQGAPAPAAQGGGSHGGTMVQGDQRALQKARAVEGELNDAMHKRYDDQ